MAPDWQRFQIDDAAERVLLTKQQIEKRVAELGCQITQDYQGKSLLVMSVLKGSVVFLADIIRQIDLPLEYAFVTISCYKGRTTSQVEPQIQEQQLPDVQNKHVLIVEDILDTGTTVMYASEVMRQKGANSVKACVLLAKTGYQERTSFKPDYIGFLIPDEFVIGYGLDYQERFRNLSSVGVLRKDMLGGNS